MQRKKPSDGYCRTVVLRWYEVVGDLGVRLLCNNASARPGVARGRMFDRDSTMR